MRNLDNSVVRCVYFDFVFFFLLVVSIVICELLFVTYDDCDSGPMTPWCLVKASGFLWKKSLGIG
jgi:hypothetical protein